MKVYRWRTFPNALPGIFSNAAGSFALEVTIGAVLCGLCSELDAP